MGSRALYPVLTRSLKARGPEPSMARHLSQLPSFLLVLTATGLIWSAIWVTKPPPPRPVAPTPVTVPIQVRVLHSEIREVPLRVHGELQAKEEATLVAQVAGQVEWTNPQWVAGAEIEAGQVLMRLDAEPFEVRLRQADAALASAAGKEDASEADVLATRRALATTRQQETLAGRELDRVFHLFQSGAASESLLDQAKGHQVDAQGSRETAEFRLASAEGVFRSAQGGVMEAIAARDWSLHQLAHCEIKAPFSGVLGARSTSRGDWVSPGQPVATLTDLTTLKSVAQVPLSQASGVEVGAQAQVRLVAVPSAPVGVGRVVGFEAQATPESRSRTLVVDLDQFLLGWAPGSFVEVRIPRSSVAGIWLEPQEYLYSENGGVGFVVTAKATVEERILGLDSVVVGLDGVSRRRVLGGLQEGEVLAISNLSELVSGASVTVQE